MEGGISMQKMKKLKSNAQRLIAKVAKESASIEANSSCGFFAYQPKEPEAVKKLRKF